MACRIKSLFGEEEKLLHCESKDCARNLAKRVDSQKDADLNNHQHTESDELVFGGRTLIFGQFQHTGVVHGINWAGRQNRAL
jgi:hypothetical protein